MGAGRNIEETSSFRIASLLMGFLFISIIFEKILHTIKHKLEHWGKTGLLIVLEKSKDEVSLKQCR